MNERAKISVKKCQPICNGLNEGCDWTIWEIPLHGDYGWKTLEIIVQVDNKNNKYHPTEVLETAQMVEESRNLQETIFLYHKKISDQDRMINLAVLRKHPNWWCIYIWYTCYTILYTEINHTTTSFVGDLVFFGRTIDRDCPFVILDLFKEAVLRKAQIISSTFRTQW